MSSYIPVFVDSQSVILLDGQTIAVELEYDENTDKFIVTADCGNFADDLRELHDKYYADEGIDTIEQIIKDAENVCNKLSGSYYTLKEINYKLEKYCERGEWYDFTWEYDDGTPVE